MLHIFHKWTEILGEDNLYYRKCANCPKKQVYIKDKGWVDESIVLFWIKLAHKLNKN